jgi:hypothetical protein
MACVFHADGCGGARHIVCLVPRPYRGSRLQCAAVVAAHAAAAWQPSADGGDVAAGAPQLPPAGSKGARGGSRLVTPRPGASGADALPPGVKLPEHGGFVACLAEAGESPLERTPQQRARAACR